MKSRITENGSIVARKFMFLVFMLPFYAIASSYPDRPITLYVAYSPGAATDFQARIVTMASGEAEYLGQPINIINKPGLGGQVGWNWFTEQAEKTGYDLAAYNIPHFIAQSLRLKTKYNIHNLEPISNWGADPAVLIVNAESPLNNVQDLIKLAKEQPGKTTMSGAGLYVGHHIATLQLEKAAGVKFEYIPTKGGVTALNYVMGGQVTAGFNNLSDAYRNQDNLKILAIADRSRNKQFLPNVRTFKELGIEVDDASVNYRGIMAPKGVPKEVISLLSDKIPRMFEDKKIEDKMRKTGSPMHVMRREEVLQMWKVREGQLKRLLDDLN